MNTLIANVFINGDLYLSGSEVPEHLLDRVSDWVLAEPKSGKPVTEVEPEPVVEAEPVVVAEPEAVVEKPAAKRPGRPRKPAVTEA